MFLISMKKKYKWPYILAIFVFLVSGIPFVPAFAQTATLSVALDTDPLTGGGAPLTGLTMTATVSGTATGPINYYFYCSATNDESTTVIPGYAYSEIGTNATTFTTPAGICDDIYDTIGTYLAKVIVQRGGIAAEERRTVGVFNPAPSLNLTARPVGTTTWSNGIIDVPYNGIAEIRWTFSGATSPCIMSGDWAGTKTVPGQEFTPNLTEGRMYTYTLDCNTSSGLLSDTALVRVLPPTLFGSLSAVPNSGMAPLTGVVLTGSVTGGTAVGTINYTFYCDRSDAGTNITLPNSYKLDGTNSLTLSTPNNVCNAVYSSSGTYTAKVIIERGGLVVESRVTINVNAPPAPVVDISALSVNISHNASTTLNWTVSNATTCTGTGPASWVGAKSVPTGSQSTGNLTGPNTYTYTLSCTGPGGIRSDSVTITVGSPPLPTVDLTADSMSIVHNSSTTLRWTVDNATTCTPALGPANWTSSGNKAIPTGNWPTGNLTGPANYTYRLTCVGPGGTTSDNVTIGVEGPPLPIVNLTAVPINSSTNPIPYGNSATLNWTSANATSCTASWAASNATSGSQSVSPTSTTTYNMSCAGPGGTGSGSITVYIEGPPPPPFVELFVENVRGPITVPDGRSVFLNWNTGDPEPVSCEGYSTPPGNWGDPPILNESTVKNPGGGWDYSGNLVGSTDPLVINHYTFTITCYNSAGVSRSDSVAVNVTPRYDAPFVELEVRPVGEETYTQEAEVDYGGSVQFRWTIENVAPGTTCEASGGWSGSKAAMGGTQMIGNLTVTRQYILTCIGPGGTDFDSTFVTVNPPPLPQVTLGVSPEGEDDYSGQADVDCYSNVNLEWEVSNAQSCTAQGNWSGSRSTNGGTTTSYSLTGNTYYGLTCENAVGDVVSDWVNVYVGECEGEAPIIFINPLQQDDIRAILDSLGGLIRMIAIALAAIMIIVSGIIIITSVDNRERLNKGKNMLKWALIGLAIALASSFIIGFLEELIE
jgi:hypothetical protein